MSLQRGKIHKILLILLLSFSLTVRAEVPTNPAANVTPQIPDTPSSSEQTKQEPDRKSGAGGAEGAAKAAAAIALAMCAMMMAQAQQMPPGPEKNMMMMQAMQQCAQAAANQQAGDKNEQAKNAVAKNDTPKGQQDQNKKEASKMPTLPTNGSGEGQSTPSEGMTDPTATTDTALGDPGVLPDSGNLGGGFDPGSFSTAGNGISTPKSIEDAQVGFNESNKGDERQINPNALGTGSFGSGVFANGDLKDSGKTGDGNGKGGGSARGAGGLSDGASGSSGLADGKSDHEGKSAFDNLMASMMGGSPQPVPLLGGPGEILSIGTASKFGVNIFQIAKQRYQKAAYNDGQLRISKKKNGDAARSLATVQ